MNIHTHNIIFVNSHTCQCPRMHVHTRLDRYSRPRTCGYTQSRNTCLLANSKASACPFPRHLPTAARFDLPLRGANVWQAQEARRVASPLRLEYCEPISYDSDLARSTLANVGGCLPACLLNPCLPALQVAVPSVSRA
jgi:hypothetical protein